MEFAPVRCPFADVSPRRFPVPHPAMRPWEPAGVQACLCFARHVGMEVSAPRVNLATLYCRVATLRDGRPESGKPAGSAPSPGREPGASADPLCFVAGLATVRWLPGAVVDRIAGCRGDSGPYSSLEDFVRRVEPGPRVARILALAGCLDGFTEAGADGWQGRTGTLLSLHRLARETRGAGRIAPMLGGFGEPCRPGFRSPPPTLAGMAADEACGLGAVYSCVPAGLFAARAASLAGRHGLPAPAGWSDVRRIRAGRSSVAGIVVAREAPSPETGTTTIPACSVLEDGTGPFLAAARAGTGRTGVERVLRTRAAVLLSGFVRRIAGFDAFFADFALGLDRHMPRPGDGALRRCAHFIDRAIGS